MNNIENIPATSGSGAGSPSKQTSDELQSNVTTVQMPQPSCWDNLTSPIHLTALGFISYVLRQPAQDLVIATIDSYKTKGHQKVTEALERPHVKACLMAGAGAAVLYKILPGQIAAFQDWRITRNASSVLIASNSTLYSPFMDFFAEQDSVSCKPRHVQARSTKDLKQSQDRTVCFVEPETADLASIIYEVQCDMANSSPSSENHSGAPRRKTMQ